MIQISLKPAKGRAPIIVKGYTEEQAVEFFVAAFNKTWFAQSPLHAATIGGIAIQINHHLDPQLTPAAIVVQEVA